jgi:hypothetical protein
MLSPVKRISLIIVLILPIVFLLSLILLDLCGNDNHPLSALLDCFYMLCWFGLLVPVPFIIPLVGTLFELIVRPFKPDMSKRIIKGSWLLMVMLIISGILFTILWSYYVYGNLYEHFDYIPWLDCSPFFLLIDHGSCLRYYHGLTEINIYELWSVYAILCWGTAIGMTTQILRIANKSVNLGRLIMKTLFAVVLTIVFLLLVVVSIGLYSGWRHACKGYLFHYPPETNGEGTNWITSALIRVEDSPGWRWRDGLYYRVEVTIDDHVGNVIMRDQVSLASPDVKVETVWTNLSDLRVEIVSNTSNRPNSELHYVLDGKTFRKK